MASWSLSDCPRLAQLMMVRADPPAGQLNPQLVLGQELERAQRSELSPAAATGARKAM